MRLQENLNKTIYGINTVIEALSSENITVEKVIIQNGRKDKRIRDVLKLCKVNKSKSEFLDKKIFNKKFSNINHQGIVAEVSDFKYFSLDEVINNANFLLILDSIHDQQNFGNIIRTAAFFGVDGIVITKDRSVNVTDTTAKTSTGAVFHIPIIKEVNLSNTILKLKKNNFQIIGTSPDYNEGFPYLNNSDKVVLIIGNEEKGIRKVLLDKCDFVVGVKGCGVIQSLNASNSAAIFVYEIMKRLNGES